MASTKPVVIRYTTGDRKNEEYVVASEAVANRVHPDAKIIRFEDGNDYPAPKGAKAAQPEETGLAAHTVPELQDMAKDRGLEGYSTLNKADLIALIEKS